MSTAEILDSEVAPPVVDEDKFYEIVDGQRVEQQPMGASESVLAYEIARAIDRVAEPARLGRAVPDVLFRLRDEPKLQRRPDVAFVSSSRWSIGRRIPRGNAWEVVPDLAVEVISPTDLAREIQAKIHEYFAAGVRLVWVLYPSESLVYVYDSPKSIRIQGWNEPLEGGDVIPGLRLVISDLVGGDDEANAR